MIIENILNKSKTQVVDTILKIENLLTSSTELNIYGTTVYAKTLIEKLTDRGIALNVIDDFTRESRFCGESVLKTENADRSIPIISSIVEGRPKTINAQLKQRGYKKVFNYLDLFTFNPDEFPLPFQEGNLEDVTVNKAKYTTLLDSMSDSISKEEFVEVLLQRLGGVYDGIGLNYKLDEQYQLEFLNFNQYKNLVDAGAFDGKTARLFARLNPNYMGIHVFEANKDSMQNTRQELKELNNIYFYENAVWNKKEQLSFSSDKSSANGIDEEGDIMVESIDLDTALDGHRIDFMKFDIEGAELKGLEGSINIIKRDKPDLAICTYHLQSHYWQIPEFLLSIHKDYRIYFRHYTEGIYESVMYFIK